MIIAVFTHVASGDPFAVYSNALKGLVVFMALVITGPGKFSLDYNFFKTIS
jgi:uncharacterized membrane protein YphA (DoxX/SURF4 family)